MINTEVKDWLNRGRGVIRKIDALCEAKYMAKHRAKWARAQMREKIHSGNRGKGERLYCEGGLIKPAKITVAAGLFVAESAA